MWHQLTACSFRWIIVTESTVRWIIAREKHCWMTADSAEPAKRTGCEIVYIASAAAACAYGRSKEHEQSQAPLFNTWWWWLMRRHRHRVRCPPNNFPIHRRTVLFLRALPCHR
jgi:hypothetical protein